MRPLKKLCSICNLSLPNTVKLERVDGLVLDLAECRNFSTILGDAEGVREGLPLCAGDVLPGHR